ncbi:acyl carrier protein [Streptomyces sp. NPDC001530]|uniref:acyl carrier protein n=1 Tax=Streptomyces sp. NPDC001530 TaxID=3364582 RepID=UPI0036C329A1
MGRPQPGREEILGVPVRPDEHFFELGGNSLCALRLGTALRARGLPPLRLLTRLRRSAPCRTYGDMREGPPLLWRAFTKVRRQGLEPRTR